MRVHHLFYSADAEQQTLHRRITPTVEQRAQQQERWNDLRDYLIDDLANRASVPMSSWLQGSYKLGTQIRPVNGGEFDIDLGLYFGWRGTASAGPHGPVQLKTFVQQSLRAYAAEAEGDVREVLEPPKERCSRIHFTGQFHIDVPAYHLDREADHRDLATQTKGWETSDPKAFFVWFQRHFADDDASQVRRLIRYVKMWAALNFDTPPSSILLTVLVAEAYEKLSGAQTETDDLALRHVVETMEARLQGTSSVPNPAARSENLNRMAPAETAAFIQSLNEFAGLARSALSAPSEAGSAYFWTLAFQHFFPAPREAAQGTAGKALVPAGFDPEVNVVARPKNGAAIFQNVNQIGPIPKDCTIDFSLRNAHQLPAGAQVQWVVRNEGAEAEQVNDLGHILGRGLTANRHSAYRGTHYMDVIVTSAFGAVLGYRRVPVRISGVAVPPRNPKRPGWTRLRKK